TDDLDLRWQRRLHDGQGVVAGRGERVGQTVQDALALVRDLGRLAVQKFRSPGDHPAEGLADRLMPEADTQRRDGVAVLFDERRDDPGAVRGTGSGREQDAVRLEPTHLGQRDPVVAMYVAGDV